MLSAAMVSMTLAFLAIVSPSASVLIFKELPEISILEDFFNPDSGTILTPTKIFDRNGELMGHLAPAEQPFRIYFPLDDQADYAAWLFQGVASPPQSALFAALPSIKGSQSGAGMLARNILLANEKTGIQKSLRTLLLTLQIEQQYEQEQIQEWSLNYMDFGNQVIGLASAAQYYFAKSVADLSLAELAHLAALAQTQQQQNINADGESLDARKELFLKQLLEDQQINQSQYAQARNEEVLWAHKPEAGPSFSSIQIEIIYNELINRLDHRQVISGGLDVVTSFDLDLQSRLDALAKDGVELIVLDPESAQLVALAGMASKSTHPPGSLLTPFIYLNAFASGYSPASLVWDIPREILPDELLEQDADTFYGPSSARFALANNLASPSSYLLELLGPENVWGFAQKAGLDNLSWDSPQSAQKLFFEGGQISLASAAKAFGVLANAGQLNNCEDIGSSSLCSISAIRDFQNNILYRFEGPNSLSVAAPELTYLTNDVLSDMAARNFKDVESGHIGASPNVALHFGATLDEASNWALAYSPAFVLGIWSADSTSLQARTFEALSIVSEYFPIENWLRPDGVASAVVCVQSGLLPNSNCPQSRRELFLANSVPTKSDDLYTVMALNQQSQLLATVFTPAEFVEDISYLTIPAEAQAWAKAAGLAQPPTEYDAILNPGQANPDLAILSPSFLSSVSGQVRVVASVRLEEKAQFRLLLGRGPNPRSWQELASGHSSIDNEQIASIDVSRMDGLFTLQLQKIDQDGKIESQYNFISVDNEPPVIASTSPQNGQLIPRDQAENYPLTVQASDNIDIVTLELILDGKSLGDFAQIDFPIEQHFSLGDHELAIVAKDAAGNRAGEQIRFRVSPD